MKVLVTGAAGFIGAALSIRLLQRGDFDDFDTNGDDCGGHDGTW